MPCSPNDVSLNVPDGPSGPALPGFGVPFALKSTDLNPFPDGFPEDLLDLLNKLQLLVPPGALKPQLNPNFGKDVFDAIMKLLDQFMPFLMLYKFFLPALELIICIIEVLCSLMNPFKLIAALNRLFTQCIPAFLNLFPIFALIIMIISLLLLILALVEYIIEQITKLVKVILRNVTALTKAFQDGDQNSVLAIAKKLGSLLCIFQNLFVLFALFNIIIQIFKDILSKVFSIPPCEDNTSDCCTSDVCPTIVKDQYTNTTGTLKYLPQVGLSPTLASPPPAAFANFFNFNIRNESWQLYDLQQILPQQFRNIFDAFDVFTLPKPIFFPTDAVYNAQTAVSQAPYAIDLRLFYNPNNWGRLGLPRFIKFTNCIMTNVPSVDLQEGDLSTQTIHNAVANIVGGLGFEDDGITPLSGFASDGITPISNQATLANFIHMPSSSSALPVVSVNDGYTFSNMTYTFKPNIAPLLSKNIVTLGCVPSIALNRTFVNNIFAGDIALKTVLLGDLINGPNFPDPAFAQQCLTTALATLRSDMTPGGVANFQTTANLCLQKLKDDTNNAIGQLVGIGFDPCNSSFTATPTLQFTSRPIIVTVDLNEKNALSLTKGISTDVATNLAARITPHITFGTIDNFVYDGYQSFTANLTSTVPGTGAIMISFDNNTFCTNDLTTTPPTHTLQTINYQFIYSPSGTGIPTSEGDTDGQPRRGDTDLSNDGSQGGT